MRALALVLALGACASLPSPGNLGLPQPPVLGTGNVITTNPNNLTTASLCLYASEVEDLVVEWKNYGEAWARLLGWDLTLVTANLLQRFAQVQTILDVKNIACGPVDPVAALYLDEALRINQ